MGRLCYPTPAPPQSCPGRPVSSHGTEILMRALAQCRGTKAIEDRKLSRCFGLKLRTLARVRVQVAAGFVMGAGFAKTMTNNLPILSVLAAELYFKLFLI